eukprot:2557486-Prymnesium_polylepis.1
MRPGGGGHVVETRGACFALYSHPHAAPTTTTTTTHPPNHNPNPPGLSRACPGGYVFTPRFMASIYEFTTGSAT